MNKSTESGTWVLHQGHESHAIEHDVHSRLMSLPHVTFSSLRVHRTPGGLCLEGFLDVPADQLDFDEILHDLIGSMPVSNRLLCGCSLPRTPK